MFDRYNAISASSILNPLAFIPNGHAVGRKMRRALQPFVQHNCITMSFSYQDGFSDAEREQLQTVALKYQSELEKTESLQFLGKSQLVFDNTFETVALVWQLPFDLKMASVKELRQIIVAGSLIADSLIDFDSALKSGELPVTVYKYRNKPCSICPDHLLWCVSGQDVQQGGGGVLEWCYDEEDAKCIFDEMAKYPSRFKNLSYGPWQQAAAA